MSVACILRCCTGEDSKCGWVRCWLTEQFGWVLCGTSMLVVFVARRWRCEEAGSSKRYLDEMQEEISSVDELAEVKLKVEKIIEKLVPTGMMCSYWNRAEFSCSLWMKRAVTKTNKTPYLWYILLHQHLITWHKPPICQDAVRHYTQDFTNILSW